VLVGVMAETVISVSRVMTIRDYVSDVLFCSRPSEDSLPSRPSLLPSFELSGPTSALAIAASVLTIAALAPYRHLSKRGWKASTKSMRSIHCSDVSHANSAGRTKPNASAYSLKIPNASAVLSTVSSAMPDSRRKSADQNERQLPQLLLWRRFALPSDGIIPKA
jgi:hypothetical protein